jgi:putative heme-binding domain-containing protein
MTFDAQGRLFVSQERGPILLCSKPDKDGVFQEIRPYCPQVKGCQGMVFVGSDLYCVGDGPEGTGLYRGLPDPDKDVIAQVQLIHRFIGPDGPRRSAMGEHGPHAVVHGPDNCLYIMLGNHAWATPKQLAHNSPLQRWPTGGMGPDQGQPGSTEDVLLPRLNDPRGHAANILAPGGTIWRMNLDGSEPALVAAGFRNAYDMAFNRLGDLITFDSDMEWDEGLPWYRAVRICNAFPGADFLWRTGSANTPERYIDSLPPMFETGRGSPVGVECYEHTVFPDRYRGAVFLADWSAGCIYALLSTRGAVSGANVEKFCTGTPFNVTDLATGPDGALYFCTGGRGTEGGVYRIVYKQATLSVQGMAMGLMRRGGGKADEALMVPQPLSAWGRARIERIKAEAGADWGPRLRQLAADRSTFFWLRIRALELLYRHGPPPDADLLLRVAAVDDDDMTPLVADQAIWLFGVLGLPEGRDAVVSALHDGIPRVRRRACEAIIRGGYDPPLSELWYLLADQHRDVRTSARLVLQRIPPEKWVDKMVREPADYIAMEAIVALCKSGQAAKFARQIAERLKRIAPSDDRVFVLDYLRVWQLVLIHCSLNDIRPEAADMVRRCWQMFPHNDCEVAQDLAILLTHARCVGLTEEPVHARLLEALLAANDQPSQQIHYFYCLRLLKYGWTAAQREQLLRWFEETRNWRGGHSFQPFLEAIFRDAAEIFSQADITPLFEQAHQWPRALRLLVRSLSADRLPAPQQLQASALAQTNPIMVALCTEALIRQITKPEAQAALRAVVERHPHQLEEVARALADHPSLDNAPILVQGLTVPSALVAGRCLEALKQSSFKPAADQPAPFRAVLTAAPRVDPRYRWTAVELLRRWTGKRFSAKDGEWQAELPEWGRWFSQTFPQEPPLPNVAGLQAASKWRLSELLPALEKSIANGNVQRGKQIFIKANCSKCHKFGSEGEPIGPDLTPMRSRFTREYILESILDPSKVISDQHRGSVLLTKKGQTLSGLVAPQGDTFTVLQSDGSKVIFNKDEIESMVASTVSPMPERLLDDLTLDEIIDLFAYLESDPK